MGSDRVVPVAGVEASRMFDLASFGERPALHTQEGSLSYRELDRRVRAMAGRLGSTRRLVVLAAANDVETIVAYLAALDGHHPVLLVDAVRPDHLDGAIEAYDADVAFVPGPGGLELVERRPGTAHDLHPDLAVLLSTSGSTGSPKLVRLSRTNIGSNARSIASYLEIGPDDRAATTLPAHYCYGLSVINSHLIVGAGLVLTGLSVVDACFWDLFERTHATSFAGVPHTFNLLDGSGFAERELPRLRYVTQAGGRLDPESVKRYAALGADRGWDLCVMYGQTEATARMAYLSPALAALRPGAIGLPIPGGEFRLDPVEGFDGPECGELVFRGDNVMMGYANEPADLARGAEVEELRTGDVARRHPDGLYEIIGRKNRQAKVFGLRIDLDDLERHLSQRGTMTFCVAVDDAIHAFVREHRRARAVAVDIAEHCGIPASAVRVNHLAREPRTPTGKVDFGSLERQARVVAEGAAHAPVPRVVTADHLRDLYAELLGRPDARIDQSFVDLGGDSLSYAEVSVRLGGLVGRLPPDWHLRQIADLVSPAPSARRGTFVETSVVLRAVCILLIVGTHTTLFTLQGGAHVLLAVAGFNFARFQLNASRTVSRLRRGLSSIVQIAVPSMVWIGAVAVIDGTYGWHTMFFLNGLRRTSGWNPQWDLWFIEALLWSLAAAVALLAVPAVARLERRVPFGFALAIVVVGLALRATAAGIDDTLPGHYYTPVAAFWCFALGWAAANASTLRHRLLLTLVVLGSVVDYFESSTRDGIAIVGILALLWVGGTQVPRVVANGLMAVASASLYIYLTHWQVFADIGVDHAGLAFLGSIAIGIAAHRIARPIMRPIAALIVPRD